MSYGSEGTTAVKNKRLLGFLILYSVSKPVLRKFETQILAGKAGILILRNVLLAALMVRKVLLDRHTQTSQSSLPETVE